MSILNDMTTIHLIKEYKIYKAKGKKAAFWKRELKRCQKRVDKIQRKQGSYTKIGMTPPLSLGT